jgi:hypothetical protein
MGPVRVAKQVHLHYAVKPTQACVGSCKAIVRFPAPAGVAPSLQAHICMPLTGTDFWRLRFSLKAPLVGPNMA